ncbi:MAG: hypothetical protein Tsb009_25150 [Planctomycetaceae bacterium]
MNGIVGKTFRRKIADHERCPVLFNSFIADETNGREYHNAFPGETKQLFIDKTALIKPTGNG